MLIPTEQGSGYGVVTYENELDLGVSWLVQTKPWPASEIAQLRAWANMRWDLSVSLPTEVGLDLEEMFYYLFGRYQQYR